MSRPPLAVCSWSLRPEGPADLVECVAASGVRAVQLALVPIDTEPAWSRGIEAIREAGIEIVSGMMETVGEDYGTLESIALTGGIRPDSTWPDNRVRAERIADLAGDHGIDLVSFHAGFIPEERSDPEREVILDRLREVASIFAARGVDVAFETGQETARTLALALDDLGVPSVGVNFDPANMILYGKGDPVEALTLLEPWVRQIHVKDATPTRTPGTWGAEVQAGTGAVDWERFLAVVAGIPRPVGLVVEREAGEVRLSDVTAAVEMLRVVGSRVGLA